MAPTREGRTAQPGVLKKALTHTRKLIRKAPVKVPAQRIMGALANKIANLPDFSKKSVKDSWLNRLLNWDSGKGVEHHLRRITGKKYNFCGPGTRVSPKKWGKNSRLDENNKPRAWSKPINKLDEACMYHDIGYGKSDVVSRLNADKALVGQINKILQHAEDHPLDVVRSAIFVRNLFAAKVALKQ